ncbi:vesicle-associated protein 2-2-like [Hibiscus syriacus]|uniref:vesicle-associated protein 2-2-like n=1 Tax=Hibiscus syriacus TaxID=106335 RepID=UPI0019243CD5|nr:vesicle-associated protein 2-2-like [Hibiscus syriacus]
MNAQLLEIEPKELKFQFILKKQCSCSVTLTNNTNQYVAFKVKTTSPKKYCVRPNVGIVMPKSTYNFTVTMQAQREAPPDMICRDKFLIQSTVVPEGTTDENITSATFVKDSGRYIEENKLKVALISPPHSPVLSPINGKMNQEMGYDRVGIPAPLPMVLESKMINVEDLKPTKDVDWRPRKDTYYEEELKPKTDAELNPSKDMFFEEELKPKKEAELKPSKDTYYEEELKPKKDTELKPSKDKLYKETLKPMKEAEPKPSKDMIYEEELKPKKDAELKPNKDMIYEEELKPKKDAGLKPMKDVIGDDFNLIKETDLKLKNNSFNSKELKPVKDLESKPMDDILDTKELKTVRVKEFNGLKDDEVKTLKTVEDLKFAKDVDEMKLKLNDLEFKLGKAEAIISKLTEERSLSTQERKALQEELAVLRKKSDVRRVQVGFPFLFVIMVALVSVFLGYHTHH